MKIASELSRLCRSMLECMEILSIATQKWVKLYKQGKCADEVVKAYFEKDFVEKVFRTLKTSEEIEPVRHRLERRFRVYIFVCVLAYRLLADLQWCLNKLSDREKVWHEADAFLYDLEQVERVQGHVEGNY